MRKRKRIDCLGPGTFYLKAYYPASIILTRRDEWIYFTIICKLRRDLKNV